MKRLLKFKILCAAVVSFSGSTASAHPTNGHLCTEIEQPTRCFDTDGFCEWVLNQCRYRCDLHDSLSDCEQIKDGCGWTNEACVQTPSALDSGLIGDAEAHSETDRSLDLLDEGLPDVYLNVSDTGSMNVPSRDSFVTHVNDLGTLSAQSSPPSCRSITTRAFKPTYLIGVLLLLIRGRRC
jgi:hypothetical protein